MVWKFLFIGLLTTYWCNAQDDAEINKKIKEEMTEFDSIENSALEVFDTINLSDATVLHLNLKTDMEKKYYIWLRRRVRDVWPYVKVAVEEYNSIQDTAKYFSSKREKKKFIKHKQQILADQFEEKLKNLSLSRGQILIKLINRETNQTAFDIIKELRGGMSAFLWNSTGGMFDLDLKTIYDPHKTREDLYIEVILQKDFISGRLTPIKESD